ncbi:discoidin domain-containing protein [Flavobacterium sp. 3HN19-14]|uniref:discoidin domain-containing protein n=1 Tax=Flavobacterium sp. 3HN19-14 TaxID=3448133 RepID=UPI003EE0F896
MKKLYLMKLEKTLYSCIALFCMMVLPSLGFAQAVTTYDRSAWTVTASSEELDGEGLVNGRANTLIDGNNATFWSSQWGTGATAYPHTLIFDMHTVQPVNQLYYVPRDNFNTSAYSGNVAFSDDGIIFGTAVPVTFSAAFSQSIISLPSVQNHRYFKITITQNYADHANATNSFVTTMAEVGAKLDTSFEATLASFTAQAQPTGVTLNWSTNAETNAVSYNITRSSDALNFTTIGSVIATGSNVTAANYTYTDTAPLTGFNFYRLELVSSSLPLQKSKISNSEFPMVTYSSNQTKNLNVFYFIPSDNIAAPGFQRRISDILLHFQTYCGNEMQREGYGNKTFGLVTDPTHTNVNIIVINGKYPKAHYPYEGGGDLELAEINAYIAAHPSPYYSQHNLIITPTFSYNPATQELVEQVPFYGIGKNCWAADFEDMKLSNLGTGGTTLNFLNTTYIGGLYHELGHGINLPHSRLQQVTQAALGTSLMSFGNSTWGISTTSLDHLDCAILDRNEIFNNDGISYYGSATATVSSINGCYNSTKQAIIITGTVASPGSPVISVGFHNDRLPAQESEYDAAWAARVTTGNRFYIEEKINDFTVQGNQNYRVGLYLIQKDGTIVEVPYLFTFTNGVPVLTPAFQPISTTITASAGANGAISSPGSTVINCADNQTYTISPNPGYNISDVVVDGVSVGAVTAYTFTNTVADHTINATFGVPLPCSVTKTWNGTAWSPSAPTADEKLVFTGNYTATTDLSACTLDVNGTAAVTVPSGITFTITGALTVAGTASLTFNSNANLTQSGASNLNTGNIIYKRAAHMRRLDYVYWSSPVEAQNLKAFSTDTQTNRFYTINESTNAFVWADPENNSFAAAKGYVIRAPNTFTTTASDYEGTFTGRPNSGDLQIAVTNTSGTGQGFNLVGNPYPSAISATAFFVANPTVTTLYFWTHSVQGSAPNANYASYNLTGGTAASATTPASVVPNGTILSGQGFIAKTSASGNLVFNNGMRTGSNSGTFFRTANTEQNRIWINLNAANESMNQMLLGYIDGATDAVDARYDGKLIENSGSRIYSMLDDEAYVIQGKALPFADTDVVPLGFTASAAGSYSISIDHVDGLFADEQEIYVEDLLMNVMHNIKETAYAFASEAGTFNNRFRVVYQNIELGVGTPVLDSNSVVVYNHNNVLNVNSGSQSMQSMMIFDVRGRLIYQKDAINSTSVSLNDFRMEKMLSSSKLPPQTAAP